TTLNYYTVNTKAKSNQNRRALRIRLKAFVSTLLFDHTKFLHIPLKKEIMSMNSHQVCLNKIVTPLLLKLAK
ncbi:hypothetical protein CGH83_23735, partial [Vibrio parahaemolyticus]